MAADDDSSLSSSGDEAEHSQTKNNHKEGFFAKLKRKTANAGHATSLQAYKTKKHAQVQAAKRQIEVRKKQFGVDYLTLWEAKEHPEKLRECMDQAKRDITDLNAKIARCHKKVEDRTQEVHNEKIVPPPDVHDDDSEDGSKNGGGKAHAPPEQPKKSSARPVQHGDRNTKPPPPKANQSHPPANRAPGGQNPQQQQQQRQRPPPPSKPTPKPPPGQRPHPPSTNNNNNRPVNGGNKPAWNKTSPPASHPPSSPSRAKTAAKAPVPTTKSDDERLEMEAYRNAPPSKWRLVEQQFSGAGVHETMGEKEQVTGKTIQQGIKHFKANPHLYVAMHYQTNMLEWPDDQHRFTYIHRLGTKGYQPKGISPSGWMTVLTQEYQHLPPFKDNVLPKKYRDKYTDNITFQGCKLHSVSNPPLLPGRGMGVGDTPNLKIIGDVDPSDIFQGQVGDCWLLSGISALAEFDGAIKRLFRKTKDIEKMPFDDGRPNFYTVTLWDLPTWTEVDIVVDERLCAAPPPNNGRLLSAKPSTDGELWVCYIEKAIACHVGGWDKLVGGQCTHAWALMTGCKEQYTIRKNAATGKYKCYGKFNSHTGKWAKLGNSPHDGEKCVYPCPWPRVGGGGSAQLELTEDQLFLRLVDWDKENYIVGAGTSGTSDASSTDGMVDNHAYAVVESHANVAGTGIGLLKVRNPWGKGEIEDGEFDDDGPGWDRYPQIKRELKPVVADDGIFWLTKKEFFQYYETIYLSASDMSEFLED